MNLMFKITLFICKTVMLILRLLKRGGTSLPGKIALKIYPRFAGIIAEKFKIIMVTGTNGKTTTTKAIGEILQKNNIKYISNRSGANLPGGIISTFIESVPLSGKCPYSTAVLEIDDAAFALISNFIEPDILVVTNFFNDQLDRYGSIYKIVDNVKKGIKNLNKTILVLNGDDPLCASLGKVYDGRKIYYGFDVNALAGFINKGDETTVKDKTGEMAVKGEMAALVIDESDEATVKGKPCEASKEDETGETPVKNKSGTVLVEDEPSETSVKNRTGEKPVKDETGGAMYCIFCNNKFTYQSRTYEHFGWFRCDNCGFERPFAEVVCTYVREMKASYTIMDFEVTTQGMHASSPENGTGLEALSTGMTKYEKKALKHTAKINLPGLYNVYNALASIACGQALSLPLENTVAALSECECSFGRMETIKADDKLIKVILVKNPAGLNQVLNFLLSEEKEFVLAFAINDKLADGTDISWLWDVDFEILSEIENKISKFYVSGTRAEDVALRLKYGGIDPGRISIMKDYGLLLDNGLSKTNAGNCFYILPNYSAMLDIRSILRKKFGLREFWK